MFDRFPLKTALLLGACITIPISQATGDGFNNFPAMGVVVPGGVVLSNVSVPAGVQPAMPSFAPVAAPTLPPVVPPTIAAPQPVMPVAPAAAQIVLPTPMPEPTTPMAMAPQAASPVIRDVAPGENPFGPSQATAAKRPAVQPAPVAVSAQAPAAVSRRDSVELQIARLKKRKLRLKDQIAIFEDMLLPDIIA